MQQTFTLGNGEQLQREHPDTFGLPSLDKRSSLQIGDYAKLIFQDTTGEAAVAAERMWVEVTQAGDTYVGTLANDPAVLEGLAFEDRITFKAQHIIDILPAQ